jgi:hypothetical protein
MIEVATFFFSFATLILVCWICRCVEDCPRKSVHDIFARERRNQERIERRMKS